ncbi:hypothetical protein ACWDZ8_32525 [Streptomyces sp. NPDC003233]
MKDAPLELPEVGWLEAARLTPGLDRHQRLDLAAHTRVHPRHLQPSQDGLRKHVIMLGGYQTLTSTSPPSSWSCPCSTATSNLAAVPSPHRPAGGRTGTAASR